MFIWGYQVTIAVIIYLAIIATAMYFVIADNRPYKWLRCALLWLIPIIGVIVVAVDYFTHLKSKGTT